MKILVVDDEELLVKGIRFNLQNDGYQVVTGSNGREAIELARDPDIRLIVLDVMMPEIDGLTACRTIREFSDVPIIMLTARTEDMDKLLGFEHGADDYLTKPFALEELAARVQAHLRRQERSAPGRPAGGPIQIGAIRLDPEKLTVTKAGAPVALSTRELELLTYLMRHAGETLSRDRIFHDVWRTDYGDVGTVAINIKNLRSKLDPEWRYIKTVWGSGYRFVTQSGFAEEEAEKG